jgi:hypothetical protein
MLISIQVMDRQKVQHRVLVNSQYILSIRSAEPQVWAVYNPDTDKREEWQDPCTTPHGAPCAALRMTDGTVYYDRSRILESWLLLLAGAGGDI